MFSLFCITFCISRPNCSVLEKIVSIFNLTKSSPNLSQLVFWGAGMAPGEQGWRSGESARLPPMWPGFDSRTRRHMWVEFVVGSRPCSERFFSRYSGFPLSLKTNISKFKFDLDTVEEEPLSGSTANPYLFILFYLFTFARGFPGEQPDLNVICHETCFNVFELEGVVSLSPDSDALLVFIKHDILILLSATVSRSYTFRHAVSYVE